MLTHRRRDGAYTTHEITSTERVNPVVSLRDLRVVGESDPQGKPTGLRVKDRGASERSPVIGGIRVEPQGDITPRRKPGDFPGVFRHERTLANRLRE